MALQLTFINKWVWVCHAVQHFGNNNMGRVAKQRKIQNHYGRYIDIFDKRTTLGGLENLFQVLIKFGLKISPHKCQLFKKELVYMGLQFRIGKAHYTAMKDKCDAIRNMQVPKSVKEWRPFCRMVNFLSSFCKNLRELLIPIYESTKKRACFKLLRT